MKKTLIIMSLCVLGLVVASPAYAGKGKKAKADKSPASSSAAILAQFDADKDGKLNDSETDALKKDYETNKTEILKQYDANNDGKLDDTEVATLKTSLTPAASGKAGKHGKKKK